MQVSRHNLEKVHSVKSQMNKLAARVEKLKEEIDKLLADDDDMRALYLKPKPAEQRSDMNPQAMHLAGYDRVSDSLTSCKPG